MYSDMSIRIRWSSESNRNDASDLHSSVLPTPVGPRNRKLPYGRFGSESPERERRMASATRRTASSCPTTRSCRRASILSSLSRSPCIIFDTGMPVARETTSAISSAPTWVRSSFAFIGLSSAFSAFLSCASSPGIFPYWISDMRCQSPWRLASSICSFSFSSSSLMCWLPATCAFSAFQISSRSEYALSRRLISSSISASRFCEASSFSFFTASRSMRSWIRRRSNRSMDSGLESISILMRAAASSMRSMALSGRKRSVM